MSPLIPTCTPFSTLLIPTGSHFERNNTKHSIVLVAGLPLDQKVVQYGPFVLNTENEVRQAMMDYRTFSNGFERAKNWRSEIGKSMVG